MTSLLDMIDRLLRPRHDDWRADGSNPRMKRWHDGRWEYREMDEVERAEAEWWMAIR